MSKNNIFANQEILTELEKRLPNFNREELIFFGKIMLRHNSDQKMLEFLEVNYPEARKLLKEGIQRLEKQESSVKVTIYRCQVCRDLILVGTDEKHENTCSKCLENKKSDYTEK